jgi:hypothetical protein
MRRFTCAVVALSTILWSIALAPPAFAQDSAAPPGGLSAADLEELVGPVALYPDELLANVLAASIYPDELKAANDFVSGGGDVAKVGEQGWEPSVVAMARIPDVLKFLNDSLDWTTALGQAYIVQAADVMAAVQACRAKAKATGALQNSPQQTVVEDGSTIIIQPADPQVIYVPQYNPQTVYVEQDDDDLDGAIVGGMIGFGVGLAVGACFDDDYDCDWHGGCVGWGYGGGHNDIEIDRNVNIETGDININSGNTVTGGDRTNVQGGNRTTNNVGREGTKFEPNSKKVDTNKIKSGGASQLQGYRGVSTNKSVRDAKVPNKTTAQSNRASPAAVNRDARNMPANNAGGRNAPAGANREAGGAGGNRTGGGGAGAAGGASGGNRPANAGTRAPANSAGNRAAPSKPPAPRTSAPSVSKSGPAKSQPSGFSPDRGSSKASSRGAASRSGGASRGSSGGSRGGGGGGGGGRRR